LVLGIASWPVIVLVAALVMGGKAVSNMAASLIFRWSAPGSMQLGFLIAEASEFVILSLPMIWTLLGAKTTSVLIASVALTLAVMPKHPEERCHERAQEKRQMGPRQAVGHDLRRERDADRILASAVQVDLLRAARRRLIYGPKEGESR
jgi:Kef-type K+ transport system membrane component KefB